MVNVPFVSSAHPKLLEKQCERLQKYTILRKENSKNAEPGTV